MLELIDYFKRKKKEYKRIRKAKRLYKRDLRAPDVPMSQNIAHGQWVQYLIQLCDKPDAEVLEIGAREVIGSSLRSLFKHANYTGFDYHAGSNVDVVGDAHKLSQYFNKKFDLIFSSAVFEHLAMPWKVSHEIAKLLKVDGYVFVETHYAYSSHERPWHFFQFSEEALKILFSPAMGFECVEAGVSNPINGIFSMLANSGLRLKTVPALYCHSEYLGKKIRDTDFTWDSVAIEDLIATKYPSPKS